jgi:hypothetical protein
MDSLRVYQPEGLVNLLAAIARSVARDYFHPEEVKPSDWQRAVVFFEKAGLIVDDIPDDRLRCTCPACTRRMLGRHTK